jgi:hypothetical protein
VTDEATVGQEPQGGTVTVTSTAFSLPTNVTTAERVKLEQFRIDNGRRPRKGDGEMYELLNRVEAEAAKASATEPRQPGESESTYAWRKQSGERTLARIEAASKTTSTVPASSAGPSATRSREASGRRSRGDPTSRGDPGDGDPRPRPSSDLTARAGSGQRRGARFGRAPRRARGGAR